MPEKRKTFFAVGAMSGTSLDGLDVALCRFTPHMNSFYQYQQTNCTNLCAGFARSRKRWIFSIEKARTFPYSKQWKKRLSNAHLLPGFYLVMMHNEYGNYVGGIITEFLKGNRFRKIDLVASHGHTVYHRPEEGITFQLGHGAAIAAACGLPVISDFRSADVALGGQGAPLVPVGDELLFPEYDFCLNLGGFANISFRHNGKRIAYDICPCNILLNRLSAEKGKEYDRNGAIASKGRVVDGILSVLNRIRYYKLPFPKSLGREWAEKNIFPLTDKNRHSTEDKLRTAVEHIAIQVAHAINHRRNPGRKRILVTGGGAHNTFLMTRIRSNCNGNIIVPDKILVDFKEALVFAFLGVLRMREEVNCLKSVTGAERDSCSGAIFL